MNKSKIKLATENAKENLSPIKLGMSSHPTKYKYSQAEQYYWTLKSYLIN
jgi:hypothetical protein